MYISKQEGCSIIKETLEEVIVVSSYTINWIFMVLYYCIILKHSCIFFYSLLVLCGEKVIISFGKAKMVYIFTLAETSLQHKMYQTESYKY